MTRVLVLESEPEVRDILGRMCRGGGYAVDEAADRASAFCILRGGATEVLVADRLAPLPYTPGGLVIG